MTSTEKAKAIRTALKEAGFNQKQINVKKQFGGYSVAFYVTIRDANIDKSTIENIVNKFKSIDYDERTGEILEGGNDYVFVKKSSIKKSPFPKIRQ